MQIIHLYNKPEKTTTTLYVEQLAENRFRMVENDILHSRLTLGTEFKTRINADGLHELVRITKASDFITRRFFLSATYKKADYDILAEELLKRGSFWQVDFGGIVTVNIPKDIETDVDKAMQELGISLSEIVDE
jgi:hypothetical protein